MNPPGLYQYPQPPDFKSQSAKQPPDSLSRPPDSLSGPDPVPGLSVPDPFYLMNVPMKVPANVPAAAAAESRDSTTVDRQGDQKFKDLMRQGIRPGGTAARDADQGE